MSPTKTEHQTEHQTKHQTNQINTETLHSNKSIVKKVQIIDINQDNVQEQHRNYFNNVGAYYANGIYVEQSNIKAREWFNRAAAQGDEDAIKELKLLDKEEKAEEEEKEQIKKEEQKAEEKECQQF